MDNPMCHVPRARATIQGRPAIPEEVPGAHATDRADLWHSFVHVGMPMPEPEPDPSTGAARSWRIAAAARECGIPKDTLRIWERRYGFPKPDRDGAAERLYSAADMDKLRLLRRLLDAGHRPGRIVALPIEDLRNLHVQGRGEQRVVPIDGRMAPYLDCVDRHDERGLARLLNESLLRQGLETFVLNDVAPLLVELGERYMAGNLAICAEHLVTETVQDVMRQAIGRVPGHDDHPRVLLTTTPGEQHGLGLLMVHALLALEGARCISLGTETPLHEIALATRIHRADIVALSYSANVPVSGVAGAVAEVRHMIPDEVALWIGGTGAHAVNPLPDGVARPGGLQHLRHELRAWRDRGTRA